MAIKIGGIKNKGGTSLTTLLNFLAAELASRVNSKTGALNRVLLIDTDQQNNLKTLYQVKTSAEGGFAAVLTQGISPKALTFKVRDNIHLLPSGGRLVKEIESTYSHTPNAELLMKVRFEEIENDFDYILVDSAPSITLVTTNILNYCDFVLTPSTLDLLGLVGTKNILQFYSLTQKHFPRIAEMLAIVPTLADFRRRVDKDLHDDLLALKENGLTEGAIITQPFRNDSKVRTTQVRRKLIQESFPNSNAAQDIKKIADEIESEITTRLNKRLTSKASKRSEVEAGL